VKATAKTHRKSTQRERLLEAMVDVTVRYGYTATTIARVIALAGVSRPTFYDYFNDKQQCFLVVLEHAHERLSGEIAHAVRDAPPQQAVDVTITTLIAFEHAHPQSAQLLMNEAMAGGPQVLEARDQALCQIAGIIEQTQRALTPDTVTPDIPARVLLGGVYRLLAQRLRQGEHDTTGVSDDLRRWIKSYDQPIAEHRWRRLEPLPAPPRWAILPETQLREPAPLPRGRRANGTDAAENQRQRILFATATMAQSKGFAATTIADIMERAGVNRRVFNAHFAAKQDAFIALIALGFQRTVAVTAGAFFTAATWPERVWEAGRAFTEFLQSSPALAHVGLVEPYAIGPAAAQQAQDGVNAFTIFLREGLETAQAGAAASPVALQAIATSIFETAYLQSRRNGASNISSLLPHMTFLCLAPIIGAAQANEFIDGRLRPES
jgi:AcrR family transcriptional regulator